MATLSFHVTIDMRTFAGFDYYSFFQGTVTSTSTSTHFHAVGDYYYQDIVGVGLVTPSYVPTEGTITDWTYGAMVYVPDPADPYTIAKSEYPYWTFSGMSLAAGAFADATASASMMAALMPTILTGNDVINGSVAADVLLGYDGNDTLNGGDGNDTLEGGAGNDILNGGNGVDAASYAAATAGVAVNLNLLGAQNTIGAGLDTISNVERVFGSVYKDSLVGNALGNMLKGGAGNDALNGAAGNDALYGEAGNDVLNGGLGADVMAGSVGNDTYMVDNAGDSVSESSGGGTDTVKSTLTFTLGANVENLTLLGTAAINGTGNDLANTIIGNGAANVINGGGGDDKLDGGAGTDTVSYAGAAAGVNVYLDRTNAQDTIGAGIDSLAGFERLIGSSYEDFLVGDSGSNVVVGGNGNDLVNGADGNDNVQGGAGNDRILGGFGNDTMTGGSGNDQFWFFTTLNAATNVDRVTDFSVADDIIYLAQGIFTDVYTPEKLLDEAAFHIGTAAHDADDRIIYNSATGALYFDADGTGAGAQVQFGILATGLALTYADFYLFD